MVVREQKRCANVGQAIAASRHLLESEFGLETLELPLSAICRTQAFRQFAAHLIERSDEWAEVHNHCLAEYRRQNNMRSPNHPIPDLNIAADEIETPFWVWAKSEPIRRRLYASRQGSELLLTDHHQFRRRARAADLEQRLGELEVEGIAIRPRALVTTMYARLVLSDVFLHGIGGAVYDVVTDEIIRRFWCVEPPRFMTASATMHLPIPCPDVDDGELARMDAELRAIAYHPETLLEWTDPDVDRLAREKREWVMQDRINGDLKVRHEAIGELNRRLSARLQSRVAELQSRRNHLLADVQRAKILASREYSFALFPDTLMATLSTLSQSD
jgi:hypothetical protein